MSTHNAKARIQDGKARDAALQGALTLFVSRLHPHGARYEPLVRVSFH